jgi:hypothetical protein
LSPSGGRPDVEPTSACNRATSARNTTICASHSASSAARLASIDVYDVASGNLIHDHVRPLEIAIQLTASEMTRCATDPGRVALLHIDSANRVTRLAPSNYDYCTTGIIRESI